MTADLDEHDGDTSGALLDFLSHPLQRSRRRGTRRLRRAVVPSLGVVAALGLVALNVLVFGKVIHLVRAGGPPAARTGPRHTGRTGSRQRAVVPARSYPVARAEPRARPAATTQLVRVRLTAARNDSWVEIRAGSATGRVLYEGVVSQGQSIHVRGRRLWARFGAIGNFDLDVDGRAVHPALNGTVDAVITAAGRLTPAP